MLKKIIMTLEDEEIIRSALPAWRRALVAYFLCNHTQIVISCAVARHVWKAALRVIGETPEHAEKIVEFIAECAMFGADDSYSVLSAWARGEIPWSEAWPQYRDIVLNKRNLPAHLQKIADELARS